jgi:sugar/nucleoside kinase (ribokinase family)
MRKGIVLAGTIVLDVVHLIDQWPEEEQIAFIRETIEAPGGPPHNAAAGLLKLGADFPVTMISVIGDDAAGQTFLDKAKAHDLDTRHVIRIANQSTDMTHVMTSKATGKRTFFFKPGANGTMTAEQMLPPDDNGKIYYLGSPGISTSMDASDGWRTALSAARTRGYKTAMELCPIPPDQQAKQVRPCLPLLDYFIINDSEAEAITGVSVGKADRFDFAAAEAACVDLLQRGVNDLVAIHHPDGAIAMRKSGAKAVAASVNVPQSEILGTVGAGDAFYAGMLLGLHDKWPLEQCLALANASAATSLHSPTTSSSIRRWEGCLAYAQAKGLRQF